MGTEMTEMECNTKKTAFRMSTDLGFGLLCGDQSWDLRFHPLKEVPIHYLTNNSYISQFFFFFFFGLVHLALWDLSSPTRHGTRALTVKAPSPNHWTIREFPQIVNST